MAYAANAYYLHMMLMHITLWTSCGLLPSWGPFSVGLTQYAAFSEGSCSLGSIRQK